MKRIWKINNPDIALKRVSEILNDLSESFISDSMSIKEIELFFGSRGFGIMLLIFSLPLAIPIPVPPGFTTIASIPLIIFSTQMMICAKHPWLPKWLNEKKIKKRTIEVLVQKANFFFRKIEKISKPRLNFLNTKMAEPFLGFFCLLCSISIANPIPLTNMIPAIGIVMVSFGFINQDGLIVLLGVALGFIGIIIAIIVTFLGSAYLLKIF